MITFRQIPPSSLAIVLFFIFKIAPFVVSALSIWFGYKLFILGVTGEASLVVDGEGVGVQLLNAAPGLFFALGGIAALIVSIRKGAEVEMEHPGETTADTGIDVPSDFGDDAGYFSPVPPEKIVLHHADPMGGSPAIGGPGGKPTVSASGTSPAARVGKPTAGIGKPVVSATKPGAGASRTPLGPGATARGLPNIKLRNLLGNLGKFKK